MRYGNRQRYRETALHDKKTQQHPKTMAEHEQWHWQEPETVWRGIGIYHVTLTITSRQPLLGTLVIPNNDPAQARVERTELGEALLDCLRSVPIFYPEIQLLQYCLMPDHIHLVWYVTKPMEHGIRYVAQGFWRAAKKVGRAYSYLASAQPPIRWYNGRNNTLSSFASAASRDNPLRTQIGTEAYYRLDPLFAKTPFIRPMSRRGQLKAMIRYIQLNPQRLATKRLMPGFFRVQKGIEINGRNYDGVGNTALLLAENFAPVHVRRTMLYSAEHGNPNPLRDYMNGCVTAARHGSVLVSPFISPQEKQVMEVLLNEQLPFIYLADNGFRDYYKPQDSLFDACAAERVLILSPWQHDAAKRHISRADCKMLNTLAEEIAQQFS